MLYNGTSALFTRTEIKPNYLQSRKNCEADFLRVLFIACFASDNNNYYCHCVINFYSALRNNTLSERALIMFSVKSEMRVVVFTFQMMCLGWKSYPLMIMLSAVQLELPTVLAVNPGMSRDCFVAVSTRWYRCLYFKPCTKI